MMGSNEACEPEVSLFLDLLILVDLRGRKEGNCKINKPKFRAWIAS